MTAADVWDDDARCERARIWRDLDADRQLGQWGDLHQLAQGTERDTEVTS